MRRLMVLVGLALVLLVFVTSSVEAQLGCHYWYCYVGEATANCSEV